MARFLVDTNTISEPTRKKPNIAVLENLREQEKELAVSTTVLHELLFGCERLPQSRKRQAIERYINEQIVKLIPIFPYDTEAARWHAVERARLSAVGITPSFADGQIAAVAAIHRLTVVTRNTPDFEAFQGVNVVNWYL